MKKFRKLLPALSMTVLATSLSSCNRGLGCPNNFSLDLDPSLFLDVVQALIMLF